MTDLELRFDRMEQQLQQKSFTEHRGLGNEVGYYIFDYPPEEELFIRDRVKQFQEKQSKRSLEIPIVVLNLYEMMLEILSEKNFREKAFQMEERNGLERVTKAITSSLQVTSPHGALIRKIQEKTPEKSILLLTGIGQCFPIIRSHTILNNLHQVLDNVPVVLLYPGKYTGQELVLFGEVKDDNYYRAFRLAE